MIAEAGLAALWLAAALSLLGLFLSFGHVRGKLDADRAVRSLAIVQGVLCLFAFALLLVAFANTDLSVALVAENSHSAKPLIYKIAGAWGNHEGSMLLWVTVLGLSGTALAALSRLPSADSLPRLRRPVGRIQPGRGRDAGRRCGPEARAGHASLGARSLD